MLITQCKNTLAELLVLYWQSQLSAKLPPSISNRGRGCTIIYVAVQRYIYSWVCLMKVSSSQINSKQLALNILAIVDGPTKALLFITENRTSGL